MSSQKSFQEENDFEKIKFVPKHLNVPRRRVFTEKKHVYEESPKDKIEKERHSFTKPLKDVEQVMRKFDETLKSKKSGRSTPKLTKQKKTKLFKTQLDQRIQYLLSLPSVKRIKSKARKMKEQENVAQKTMKAVFSEAQRLRILASYELYIRESASCIGRKPRVLLTQG